METEAEAGVKPPYTEESQGLPETPGAEREARNRFSPEPVESVWPCCSQTVRESLSVALSYLVRSNYGSASN